MKDFFAFLGIVWIFLLLGLVDAEICKEPHGVLQSLFQVALTIQGWIISFLGAIMRAF